jgi:hypothetical protein
VPAFVGRLTNNFIPRFCWSPDHHTVVGRLTNKVSKKNNFVFASCINSNRYLD